MEFGKAGTTSVPLLENEPKCLGILTLAAEVVLWSSSNRQLKHSLFFPHSSLIGFLTWHILDIMENHGGMLHPQSQHWYFSMSMVCVCVCFSLRQPIRQPAESLDGRLWIVAEANLHDG